MVTGRNRYIGDKVNKKLKRSVDIIGCNGAFIYSDGQLIKEDFLPNEEIRKLIDEVEREQKVILVFLFTKTRNIVIRRHGTKTLHSWGYGLYQFLQGVTRDDMIRSDKIFYEELQSGKIYKAMLMMGVMGDAKARAESVAKQLSEKYENFSFTYSGQMIEISPKGCTKSSGIAFYLDYNKINHDNILVVGDSGNDISMFEAFPEHSFCMDHAPKSVTSHAKHTIRHFAQLADYIYPSEEKDSQTSETKEG